MRSGRHGAQYTVLEGKGLLFGVVRPGWGGVNAQQVDGHCFYFTADDGICCPGPSNWEGSQSAKQGDRIGMLLDLDQGSMTVWKNDVKLGVMAAKGLSGPYCWAVSLWDLGSGARMETAPAPASSTEEELAAAKVWQRRNWLGLPSTATDAKCEAAEAAAVASADDY